MVFQLSGNAEREWGRRAEAVQAVKSGKGHRMWPGEGRVF